MVKQESVGDNVGKDVGKREGAAVGLFLQNLTFINGRKSASVLLIFSPWYVR